MSVADYKELINTIFEGLLSIIVVVGAGWMISAHPESTTVVGTASGALLAVITFWFSQRGQVKAVNGNIAALANIAGQMIISGKSNPTVSLNVPTPTPTTEVKINANG